MYTTVAEGGLSSPAVVNDVVLISTTKVSLYAFDANDGTPLWSDDLGMQTFRVSTAVMAIALAPRCMATMSSPGR